MDKKKSQKAGHYEILGETYAKWEFFEHGFNPYSRYLDVDKVDLILRKKEKNITKYYEVQVKYGKLYKCGNKWEQDKFDYTSWRFFKKNEFDDCDDKLYLAYVMVPDEGYKKDIFIFPIKIFRSLLQQGIPSNTKKGPKVKIYIAHSPSTDRWYLWKKYNFKEINEENCLDVTKYRRNFDLTKK